MSGSETLQASDRIGDAGSPLALALESHDARLRLLEAPRQAGRLERVQKAAAFVALVIGIFLSSMSLFDVFWVKPRDSLLRDTEEFNRSVNAVANLRQGLIKTQYESNNPQMLVALTSMVMPQVLANIQYATALLPRLGDRVGVPQLIVLISESMNIYDWKSAEVLVERAISARDAVPSIQSEAHRYKGRLMFATGRLNEGRSAYQSALNALRNEAAFGINATRAYVVSDWIIMEFSVGDCLFASARIKDFIDLVQQPQIMPQARSALIGTLKEYLPQLPRCAIPAELRAMI